MFVVLLRFSDNKDAAGRHMDGHAEWLRRGREDGVFLLAGSIQPGLGGAILAHGVTRAELDERVAADPFVAENVVSAEVLEIAPGMADERLSFLL
ncbi:YciI family protein [Saccharothrix sp.]|uniref:YciI family protein n=1 Tax=Saccharothrix sp. TaxID=1873460 RepID=UPI002810C31A|nr:YciI family protein [Saccharothrix sp.]